MMTKIYEITGKASANELKAVDAVGRGTILFTKTPYKVGEFVVVVNGVVVGKTKKQDTKTYVV